MNSSLPLPKSVCATLWSYDTNLIDIRTHKRLIISNVLNFGTKEATDWLFKTYSKDEIAKEANLIPRGQWNDRSRTLWSLVLQINPRTKQEMMG